MLQRTVYNTEADKTLFSGLLKIFRYGASARMCASQKLFEAALCRPDKGVSKVSLRA